tara:strand:+ start:24 stop:395 length:372 start_codon:yes stop_codon:yes gene_type:complete
MATINITIGNSLNESLSVGDIAYYAHLGASAGGFQSNSGNITKLGEITVVNTSTNTITVDVGSDTITSNQLVPANKTMLLFSKDAAINTSGLTGYYASVKMKNTSTTESELFSVGSEVVQSSK